MGEGVGDAGLPPTSTDTPASIPGDGLAALTCSPMAGPGLLGLHRLSLETRLVTEQPWGCLTDGVYQSLINLPTWGSGWNPTFTHEGRN